MPSLEAGAKRWVERRTWERRGRYTNCDDTKSRVHTDKAPPELASCLNSASSIDFRARVFVHALTPRSWVGDDGGSKTGNSKQ